MDETLREVPKINVGQSTGESLFKDKILCPVHT